MTNSIDDTSPSADDFDSLVVHKHRQVEQLSPVGELVREAIVSMNANGDEAEEHYQKAIRELRQHPVEGVIEIARMESTCHPADYSTRFALVYAACELEHRAALPLLRSIVLTPIPEELSSVATGSTVAEESIIRTAAVDGIARLAQEEDKDVVNFLLEFLNIPSFSIRRAAVQGTVGQSTRRRILKVALPSVCRRINISCWI